MLAFAVLVGARTSDAVQDVDEVAFRQTLEQMQHGDDYYSALRDALVAKEHRPPPSNVRAYRLPTLYLVLARLPSSWWRWAATVPYAAMIFAAWAIGSRLDRYGGPAAAVLVGVWAIASAPHAYLYTEMWGAAALLVGLAFAQRDRRAAAACGFATAALLRELYIVAFLVGLIRFRHSRVWQAAAVVVTCVGLVHLYLASRVLDPNGFEPPLSPIGGRQSLLSLISPGTSPIASFVGAAGLLGGAAGLVYCSRLGQSAARIALFHAATLLVATLFVGRSYWALTFGPSTAAFVGASFGPLRRVASRTNRPRANA
jgi:hypothetical protein